MSLESLQAEFDILKAAFEQLLLDRQNPTELPDGDSQNSDTDVLVYDAGLLKKIPIADLINLDEIYESDSRIDQSVSFNRPSGSWHNTPNNPHVDTIPIAIIAPTEENASRDGNLVGVWFKTNNAVPAYSGFTNQILKDGALIPGELCLVWLTFYKTAGLIVQSIQTFSPAYIPNEIPLITLIGANNVNSVIGAAYVDAGATALDTEDGDISANIVVGGDVVDINTLGAYVITFNVQDSNGANATEVTRTVNVVSAQSTTPGVLSQAGNLIQL